jgi:aerobic-type carbon monoxide dehydrogenase small subunit (CoxS/CutS family)
MEGFAIWPQVAYSQKRAGSNGLGIPPLEPENGMVRKTTDFTLNGEAVSVEADTDQTLLGTLRTDLEKTGTKYGCGVGMCGTCTVLIDGVPTRSCLTNLDYVQGKDVLTIEGMASGGELHPLQREFFERGAYQCGYCTPGMIMNAHGLLQGNPNPSREEIVQGMEGNLCRCSAYKRIVEAIEAYAGSNGGDHE